MFMDRGNITQDNRMFSINTDQIPQTQPEKIICGCGIFRPDTTEVKIFDNKVRKIFYLKKTYRSRWFMNEYTFDKFKLDILKNYQLAEKYRLCKIIPCDDKMVITEMPRYKTTLLHAAENELFDVSEGIQKIKNLISWMKPNQLDHTDLFLRNICLDEQNQLCLIDLENLCIGEIDDDSIEDLMDQYIESYK